MLFMAGERFEGIGKGRVPSRDLARAMGAIIRDGPQGPFFYYFLSVWIEQTQQLMSQLDCTIDFDLGCTRGFFFVVFSVSPVVVGGVRFMCWLGR